VVHAVLRPAKRLTVVEGKSGRALGKPSVTAIGDNFEQVLDAPAPDRCDDPELG